MSASGLSTIFTRADRRTKSGQLRRGFRWARTASLAEAQFILNETALTDAERDALAKHARRFPLGWTPSRKGLVESVRPIFYPRLAMLLRLHGLETLDLAVGNIEFRLSHLVQLWEASNQ